MTARPVRGAAALAALAAVTALAALPAGAQRPGKRPTTEPAKRPPAIGQPGAPTQPGARGGAAARPTTPGDTSARGDSAKRPLVTWAEEDSVMQALLARQGYQATRYQGDTVTFAAQERAIFLVGTPSAVGRGEAVIVGDTIVYNDSLNVIQVRGDTVVLRDPSYQPDDVIARRFLEYDLARRIGTVRELSTAVESGQRWYVHGKGGGQFVNDTSAARRNAFYVRNGEITSCEEAEPHYHFAAQEIKVVAKNVLVARPAVLYIGNVPVMWLPFIFQDLRSGRRSGILTPRFGVSELVRNGPGYRRTIDNLGYYFALNDYMDAQLSLDWRSGARGTEFDPGFVRYTGEWQYNWIDRFLSGHLAATREQLRNGAKNTAVSWSHSQSFSQRTRLSTNINYVTNTNVQRRISTNPFTTLANIRSQANYSTGLGPLNLSVGGSRVQYPGQPQVDLDFPSVNIATQGPLNLASWLVWTPTVQFSNRLAQKNPITGTTGFQFFPNASGGLDSSRLYRDQRNTTASFGTPIRIFDFNWNNSFSFAEEEQRGPQQYTTTEILATGDTVVSQRFYQRTFATSVDWNTSVELPRLSQGKFNIVPNVSIQNVESGPFWVRSIFSNGDWVHQSKRLSYGVSSSPTIFGLFPGFGPVSRFRHSLTPVLSWSYAPDATGKVSREYLRARNLSPTGGLSALAQNQVSLALSTNIEAKLRAAASDTGTVDPEAGRKIKLLSVNFTTLTYDFVRADTVGNGLTNRSFDYNARSDLLPGFDLRVGYSLYQGDPNSDTAVFKPYRENVAMNFSLNRNSAIFGMLGRLLHVRGPQTSEIETDPQGTAEQAMVTNQVASQQVAGSASRTSPLGVPRAGQGWQATLSFSSTRQRPVVGGNQQVITAADICEQRGITQANPAYSTCLLQAQTELAQQVPGGGSALAGGTIYRTPPNTMLTGSTSFNITPKWAAQWSTSYDMRLKEFGMHQVSLQRELHDWRAIFAFTQAPNGAFAFNFFIALNAEPDLKFDYQRRSYRNRSF